MRQFFFPSKEVEWKAATSLCVQASVASISTPHKTHTTTNIMKMCILRLVSNSAFAGTAVWATLSPQVWRQSAPSTNTPDHRTPLINVLPQLRSHREKPPFSQWPLQEGPRSPPSYLRDPIFPHPHCYTYMNFSVLPATPRRNTAWGSCSRSAQIPRITHGSPSSRWGSSTISLGHTLNSKCISPGPSSSHTLPPLLYDCPMKRIKFWCTTQFSKT